MRDQRPEHRPRKDHEGGRQHHQSEQEGGCDPNRPCDAERRVIGQHRDKQREQSQDHGHSGGGDCRSRGPKRAAHRLVTVRHHPQLLAIARDQQQSVVGTGAEYEDLDDSGDRGAEGKCCVPRNGTDDPSRDLVGNRHHGERDEPEDGTPIGDQEQNRDDHDGREKKGHVGPAESVIDVGLECSAAGHLGLQARRQPRLRHAPDRLDRGVGPRAVDIPRERHRHKGCCAIV